MIYNFRNDNYKNFDVYRDNVLKSRAYFIPFNSRKALEKTDILTERYSSDKVEVLSGEWDFKYYSSCTRLPVDFDSEREAFDKITVPSCWQFTGYENPCYINTRYEFECKPPVFPYDCPIGVYRRFFNAESGADYILSFLGAAGAIDVYVNGRYVGYSEGSHNTSEFDINPFVKDGENELVVLLHKFSNGTYLECQDMFRNNGIFRDVLLYKYGENYIYDFEVKTEKNASAYSLDISADIKGGGTLKAELFFGKRAVASAESENGKITFPSLDVEEWSAEIPNLYTLYLTLEKDGRVTDVIRRSIGFKHIEIKGNVFYFNGEKIKLLGVNHHDTDAKKGYVMSVSDMERDVKIFKEYNVNCVRTSHYPPDPIFIDLCDKYGVYVVDEADIETHGVMGTAHPRACSHNPEWKPRYIDRVMRMFERDKNHPSITMWSLGNESWGYSNHDACYKELKKRTPIPIHYEGVVRTKRFAYDVISQMYPWQNKMKKMADGTGCGKKWYEKPYYLCEYAHAMGVGAGELETYVKDFLRADNMMGGCIWEFADHAVFHENGKYKYTYGGDHREKKHDGNFCVDGLFFPDRTPHAGAIQMKNCYRPVRAKKTGRNEITFTCLNYFKGVDYTVEIKGVSAFEESSVEEIKLTLSPRESKIVKYTATDCDAVVITYLDGKRVIAEEQLEGSGEVKFGIYSTVSSAPIAKTVNNRLFVEYDGGEIVFNMNTGEIDSYTKNAREYISAYPFSRKSGFCASIFRAPLDNDMYLKKVWNAMKLETEQCELTKFVHYKDDFCYVIETKNKLFTDKMTVLYYTLKYSVMGDGSVNVELKCTYSRAVPYAPRFGLTLSMPKKYENVEYFGLGERTNLPDFKEHAMLGTYKMKVDGMCEKHIKPQEASMRCGVKYAEVKDKDGHGLAFISDGQPMIFSADNFTSQQCAKAMHREELKPDDFTYLHFDAYHLGAGSGACGPVPTGEYKKNSLKNLELSLTVKPI